TGMAGRWLGFRGWSAPLQPLSLLGSMVGVLATAHRPPARMAQTTRWGACRTSAPIAVVPRNRAGRLQRARNTPATIASEITTGDRPSTTILVGASAAPSQAPAVKPLATPASCKRRRRDESSAGAIESIRAPRGRRPARRRGPRIERRAAWRSSDRSPGLLGVMAGGELTRRDLAQRRGLGATARVLLGVRAAGGQRAAGWWLRGRRHVAREDDTRALRFRIGHRHGGEERRGVGVPRRGVQLRAGRPFHDL